MRSSLADYQFIGPAGPAGDSWLATAPARLGGQATVVVTELAPGVGDWGAVSERVASLASVRSSYLPRLIEAGQTDEADGPVTWVTRADGRPGADVGTATDPDVTLRRLAAVARGAHDLHEAGWVHGDIGPRSVLQRGDETLLEPPIRALGDPGPVTRPTDLDTVDPATVWGEGPSRAADIWALGATAHRLLSGQYVHPALPQDLIVTAVQRILVEPPVVVPTLSAGVAALLRSCLATDPADRPPTAADLAESFERLAASR